MNPSAAQAGRMDRLWDRFVVSLPYLWLLVFFLLPFLFVLKISLADPIVALPPFTPLLDLARDGGRWFYLTLDNYRFLLEDDLYWVSYLKSIRIAFISTILCLLIGYPMAYAIARAAPARRNLLSS